MLRLSAIQREAERLLHMKEFPNVHELHAFIRECRALRPLLLPAVLQTQFLKLSAYAKQFGPEARQELQWWLQDAKRWLELSPAPSASASLQQKNFAGNALPSLEQQQQQPSLEIYTDASLTGWGAVLYPGDIKVSGGFAHSRLCTSNWRELHAIGMAIRAFSVHGPRAILVKTDSVTAAAYINKEGGPVAHLVAECKHNLIDIIWPKGLWVKAVHVAGETNIIADRLSRNKFYYHHQGAARQI
jgi:ribonuclease HI